MYINLCFHPRRSLNHNQKMTDFLAGTKPVSSPLITRCRAMQVFLLLKPLLERSLPGQFMEILLLQRLPLLVTRLLIFTQLFLFVFAFSFVCSKVPTHLFALANNLSCFAQSLLLTLLPVASDLDHRLLDLLLQVQTECLSQSQQRFPVRMHSECRFKHSIE